MRVGSAPFVHSFFGCSNEAVFALSASGKMFLSYVLGRLPEACVTNT